MKKFEDARRSIDTMSVSPPRKPPLLEPETNASEQDALARQIAALEMLEAQMKERAIQESIERDIEMQKV